MEERETDPKAGEEVREAVRAFYDLHPYPPPVDDIEDNRRRWQDENRHLADFHLHWPRRPYSEDLRVLVAGCGTSQAAKHALRRPSAHVTGIDLSEASIRHTLALKQKYNLSNLNVHRLPIERVGELGEVFDLIVCTGVLHHLPDPGAGLRALREVLEPDGAMHLMVYAPYGRAGVYMLQEYCRRLGIGHSDPEIRDLAHTLAKLPQDHPLARLLGQSPDFQRKDALADALLNPQDRAFSVPQLFAFIQANGLNFGRWLWQAPYLPVCGLLADAPHSALLAKLPQAEQFAAVELFRGTMVRHSLVVHRADRPGGNPSIRFDGEEWLDYVPIRFPGAINVYKQLPPGFRAVLLNQDHTYPDLYLPVNASEKALLDRVNGRRTIAEIWRSAAPGADKQLAREQVRAFFERLWRYDQVVFDASIKS